MEPSTIENREDKKGKWNYVWASLPDPLKIMENHCRLKFPASGKCTLGVIFTLETASDLPI